MTNENINALESLEAGFVARNGADETVEMHGVYTVEHRNADGELLYSEEFHNLVTTVGKNDLLDKYLGAATTTFFLGLKGTGTAVVGDTMSSHAGWQEVGAANAPAYSGTRKTPAFSAASGGSKVMSAAAAFTFTSAGTVAGCFLNAGGTSAQDNTTGVLYSAGDFASARAVQAGDTLNVTYTASA